MAATDSSVVPAAPPSFDPDTFFAGTYWHQRWPLFQGVVTPGVNDVLAMLEHMDAPSSMAGMRVLDIGAWNGLLSFECERRGAAEVLAIGPEPPEATGFFRVRDAIGSTKVTYQLGSCYDLDPGRIGRFDLVFFCGVLYRLRYPLLGIDNLRRVCRGEVFVETFIIDNYLPVSQDGTQQISSMTALAPRLANEPMWQFYRVGELSADASNWFGPNRCAVLQAFESAGFAPRLTWEDESRGCFRASVVDGPPEFLRIRSGEDVYYETLVSRLFGPREAW